MASLVLKLAVALDGFAAPTDRAETTIAGGDLLARGGARLAHVLAAHP